MEWIIDELGTSILVLGAGACVIAWMVSILGYVSRIL